MKYLFFKNRQIFDNNIYILTINDSSFFIELLTYIFSFFNHFCTVKQLNFFSQK